MPRRPKFPRPDQPTLFDLGAPTPERARALCERIPPGASLSQEYKACGQRCCARRAMHGPYWIARFTDLKTHKTVKRYVGSQTKLAELLIAWELVRKERAAARAAGEAVPRETRKRGRVARRRRRASPVDTLSTQKNSARRATSGPRDATWRDHATHEAGAPKRAGNAGE